MSAISDYFRTALLIDDRVAADYLPLEPLREGLTEHSDEEPVTGLAVPAEEDETPVHPSELVRAFLEAGVVCSVLEATESSGGAENLVRQALQGSMIADLLLLDWLMHGDYSSTLRAIETIAAQHSDRLAVIVVFTGAYSLGDVVQRLKDEAQFQTVDDFVVRRDNTIVLVFGKPGVQLTGGESQRQASDYGALPQMIRDDLELIYRGLMPEFAFGGINALREAAPRILATFDRSLDAGALIHRALLPEPADAATQFVRLLASDFEQVLHDRRVGDLWHIDSSPDSLASLTFTAALETLTQGLLRLQPTEGLGKDARAKALEELERLRALGDEELARDAIARGLGKFRELGLVGYGIARMTSDLAAAVTDGVPSSECLAILMDSSGFGNDAPRLELGVIVRDAQKRYWLCVQPLCDSVRLTENRAFPMLGINIVQRKPAAMIRSPEGEALAVEFDRSPHKLRLVSFAPNDGAVHAEDVVGRWCFRDAGGNLYEAVTRLRHEFAAQALHGLTTTASRVGADGSEWLRRLEER